MYIDWKLNVHHAGRLLAKALLLYINTQDNSNQHCVHKAVNLNSNTQYSVHVMFSFLEPHVQHGTHIR